MLRSRSRLPLGFSVLTAGLVGVGCVAVAGVSDFAVDPCFEGCDDALSPPLDATVGADTSPPDRDGATPPGDAGRDALVDAPPPPSPGKSVVTVAGTGVAVGRTAFVTLTARNDLGEPVARTGAKVVFTTAGGTSVVTFGAVTDKGDGTYRAVATGVTEGTKLNVSAMLDGVPLTTPAASLRVANPVTTGVTALLDASNADRLGNAGSKSCPASAPAMWSDLGANTFVGSLRGYADACTPGSGWAGDGSVESPFRLAFDGVDDHVGFVNANSLQKYTVLAWVRKTGPGLAGTSGTGGVDPIVPLVTRGTAETDTDVTKDINFYLGISGGHLASDYEQNPGSLAAPLVGGAALADDTWYMVGTTLDATAPGTRALYVDGAVDGTSVPALPPQPASAALFIIGGAKRTDGNLTSCPATPPTTGCARFQGEVAVVITYDRALTAAEIQKNCHSFSSRFGMTTCAN